MQRLYKLSESRFTGFKDFEDKSLFSGDRWPDNFASCVSVPIAIGIAGW